MTTEQPHIPIAKVKPNWDCWGLINLHGDYIIDPIFKNIFDWKDSIARLEKVSTKIEIGGKWTNHLNGQYGFVNSSGNLITDFSFGYANDFSCGLAAVCKNEKWGFINIKGSQQIQFQFDKTSSFQTEGCVVQFDNKFGLIDINGNWKLENKFETLSDFSFGLSVASIKEGLFLKKEKKIIIDINGNKVVDLPSKWQWFKPVSEEIILIGTSSGYPGSRTYGFMNLKGEIVTQPQFYTDSDFNFDTGEFSEGLLAVKNKDQKNGFVNSNGEISIELKYDSVASFRNGISKVSRDGRTFYIDKTGKEIAHKEPIPQERPFDEVLDFSEGLAVARKGDFWGVINEVNNVVTDFKFKKRTYRTQGDKGLFFSERSPRYSCGLIGVCEEREDNIYSGYIDKQGDIAIALGFRVAEPFV